jgi:16S rRNA G1207 methylase RsmC
LNKQFEEMKLLSTNGIPGSTLFSRAMCDTLADNLPKRLLDIGCGSGVVGLYCLLNGSDFVLRFK